MRLNGSLHVFRRDDIIFLIYESSNMGLHWCCLVVTDVFPQLEAQRSKYLFFYEFLPDRGAAGHCGNMLHYPIVEMSSLSVDIRLLSGSLPKSGPFIFASENQFL